MKKFFLVLLVVLFGAALAACDSKKGDGGGETPPPSIPNTTLSEDNLSTFQGNYKVTKIIKTGVSDNTLDYDTDIKSEIIDLQGAMVITEANPGITINVKGAFQVGGNLFIDSSSVGQNDKSAVVSIRNFVNNGAIVSNFDTAVGSITFRTSEPIDSANYVITMTKINDDINIDPNKEGLWKEMGLCYRPSEGQYFNCVMTNVGLFQPVDSATKLIGNYYIDKIDIISEGASGCSSSITRADDGLVGELAASARHAGEVTVGIALKFQFEKASCNLGNTNNNKLYNKTFNHKIIITQEDINNLGPFLDNTFTNVGLSVIGTETITYNPKEQAEGSSTFSERLFNGAQIKITLKKARDGQLGLLSNNPGFAKPLDDTPYYTIN